MDLASLVVAVFLSLLASTAVGAAIQWMSVIEARVVRRLPPPTDDEEPAPPARFPVRGGGGAYTKLRGVVPVFDKEKADREARERAVREAREAREAPFIAAKVENATALLEKFGDAYVSKHGGPGLLAEAPQYQARAGMPLLPWTPALSAHLVIGMTLVPHVMDENASDPRRLWIGRLPWERIMLEPAARLPDERYDEVRWVERRGKMALQLYVATDGTVRAANITCQRD